MNGELNDYLKSIEPKIRKYRRDFHQYAEIAWGEYRTASIIANHLEEWGYTLKLGREVLDGESRMGLPSQEMMEGQYQRALSEGAVEKYVKKMKDGFTGIVGEIKNGKGPTIGFRFDIDAVEMSEKTEKGHLPYQEGFMSLHSEAMHSCGHDGHAAIGLGLAEVLSKIRDKIRGNIKLIFQPAEEGARGAKAMVNGGVVDEVDYLFGMHIGTQARKTGEFFCGTDKFLATSKFDVTFHGFSTHAGFDPQEGKNALLSAATAVINLYAIPRHSGGGTRINVGKLSAGSARNVIPDKAHLMIETRGEDSNLNIYMKEYAEKIIKSSAEMHGNNFTMIPMGEAENGDSDDELMREIYHISKKYNIFPELRKEKAHLGGSEDFTHMMNRVLQKGGKSTYLLLGSHLKGKHHTNQFDFDESILINGVKILSVIALELTKKKKL